MVKHILKVAARTTAMLGGLALFGANSAFAVPALQLDIVGGEYVGGEEQSIITSESEFDLLAMATVNNTAEDSEGGQLTEAEILAETFYLSVAIHGEGLTGDASEIATLGSVEINGVSYSSWVWGTPPPPGDTTGNPDDIGPHDIYPTWYLIVEVDFNVGDECGTYNTQEQAGIGEQAGTGSWCQTFNVNMADLGDDVNGDELNLHFDLYSLKIKQNEDVVRGAFAPFSHDAGTSIPEPGTLALIGAALLLLGFSRRRANN